VCLALVLLYPLTRQGIDPARAAAAPPEEDANAPPTPAASAPPEPTSAPTATPEPTPEPEPDYTCPVPEGEAKELDWFDDAVFIGASRTDGFKLYSGVTTATFLDHTGVTLYEIMDGKEVIRQGAQKVSVLDALGEKQFGKVYIDLGINELGYNDAEDFANTYAGLIDQVRALQPDAVIYVQAIIPVNTEKCLANEQPSYVTNERIAAYNEALAAMTAEKKVWLVDPAQVLADENGEGLRDLSADGVHFKREGYAVWRDYLLCHTGEAAAQPQT